MKLDNKNVLITGGTDGLGYAIGKLLIKKGAIVYAVGRDMDRLRQARHSSHSLRFYTFQCDVSDPNQIKELMDDVGRVDILINAAGVWLEGQLADNSIDHISQTIDINLKGVIFTTKAVLPQMLKRKSGFIVNIVSTSGLKGRPNESVYDASKFGVTGFTKAMQEDLLNTNIKLVGIYPGGMKTQLFAKAGHPKSNTDWMDPVKVAETVAFILEQDDTLYLNEVVINKRPPKTLSESK